MQSFEQFVREHQDMVYSTAMRITGDPHESHDIAQQVFVSAYERFGELQSHENPGGWLRLTARNLSINHVTRYRKRRLFFGGTSGDSLPCPAPHSAQTDWLYERHDLLKRALGRLPRRQRAVLALFYYEDLPVEEIARTMGCTAGKVKVDLHRARNRLKDHIERLEQHDG